MAKLRRNPLPDDLRRSLTLERGERVLAYAQLFGGGAAVATDRALHLTPGPPPGAPDDRAPGMPEAGRVIPWHRVLRARWVQDDLVVLVEESTAEGSTVHRLVLEEPSLLAETLRERVTASIVVTRQLKARGEAAVRVVGRRVPGAKALQWQVIRDPGATGPDLEERIAATLRELQEQTGS